MDNDEKNLFDWMLRAFPAFWAGEVFILLLVSTFGGQWKKLPNGNHDMIWQFLIDGKVIGVALAISLVMGLSMLLYARKK